MKILITGGAGFIGSHLAARYASCANVVILDDLSSGVLQNLHRLDVELIQGTILDPEHYLKSLDKVDFVFHLAAMTSVAESMGNPSKCVENNTLGTIKMIEWSKSAGAKKFIFASSAAVYGDSLDLPKTEFMAPEPKSPYALTKLDGEFFCEILSRGSDMGTTCLRFFNVFGPRQNAKSAYAAAVPIFFENALHNREIVIHGDGNQTRDFIYIDDIVSAMAFVAECPQANGVYNLGYGRTISINQLVDKIKVLTGSTSLVRYAPERAGDVKHSVASVDRIKELGYKFEGSLDLGLAKLADFFRR
jgi:UDP-glucose 4-epimerase